MSVAARMIEQTLERHALVAVICSGGIIFVHADQLTLAGCHSAYTLTRQRCRTAQGGFGSGSD
jgi:hypothetical protein